MIKLKKKKGVRVSLSFNFYYLILREFIVYQTQSLKQINNHNDLILVLFS